ncbi:hypothetical protein [Fodinibius sp. AD559]|uniref:hypothetical protein n=1 Tax=Fodinibius sp. AD559 TaxID=3424179 RepID=UPI0040468B07
MSLSVPGCIAWHYWWQIPNHQSDVVLDEFVVMPNHIHGIVGIESSKNGSAGMLHATSVQNENLPQDEMSNISPDSGSSPLLSDLINRPSPDGAIAMGMDILHANHDFMVISFEMTNH